ncbi:hypothetical protein GGS23DRAFT_495012 [Durotheca rogersii]|uniref:uncharacterized protein n=1 Tax=Durotheca rogersii TaxID=419775 RepID=UPI00221F1294|nr:uncharacterized protein GGS23DRAFT_495012 [Durotheca rogersii]KAI5864348.1 hypothetical protein GGS23DRAFT_495012 [Durotheca rogersii]
MGAVPATWHCPACNADFVGPDAAEAHLAEHASRAGGDRGQCDLCDGRRLDKKQLAAHLKDPVFHNICPVCKTDFFRSKSGLDNHISRKHARCPVPSCGVVFERAQIQDHLAKKHPTCNTCDITYADPLDFIAHKHRVHIYCDDCGVDFPSAEAYEGHCSIYHPGDKSPGDASKFDDPEPAGAKCNICEHCYEAFATEALLSAHRSCCPKLECEKCGYRCVTAMQLCVHLEEFHLYCRLCNKWFESPNAMKRHRLAELDHRQCSNCKRTFNEVAALLFHWQRYHHLCLECRKGPFMSTDDLNEHLRGHALGEDNKYYCLGCKRISASMSTLLKHQEEAHHYCDRCKIFFESGGILAAHKSMGHKDPKPQNEHSMMTNTREIENSSDLFSVSGTSHHSHGEAARRDGLNVPQRSTLDSPVGPPLGTRGYLLPKRLSRLHDREGRGGQMIHMLTPADCRRHGTTRPRR